MITWNKKINWIDSNYNTFNLRRRNYKPYTHKKIYEGGITKETRPSVVNPVSPFLRNLWKCPNEKTMAPSILTRVCYCRVGWLADNVSALEWQKVFCRTFGEGLSRLRLNKNSIVPIRINDFGHEIDNADRELYERSDTICQKNEVFSYRVWRPLRLRSLSGTISILQKGKANNPTTVGGCIVLQARQTCLILPTTFVSTLKSITPRLIRCDRFAPNTAKSGLTVRQRVDVPLIR